MDFSYLAEQRKVKEKFEREIFWFDTEAKKYFVLSPGQFFRATEVIR